MLWEVINNLVEVARGTRWWISGSLSPSSHPTMVRLRPPPNPPSPALPHETRVTSQPTLVTEEMNLSVCVWNLSVPHQSPHLCLISPCPLHPLSSQPPCSSCWEVVRFSSKTWEESPFHTRFPPTPLMCFRIWRWCTTLCCLLFYCTSVVGVTVCVLCTVMVCKLLNIPYFPDYKST